MDAVTAQRTLVKSPPELWSEVGEVASLARHLGAFGEIRITRTTAGSTVAWEGERASGTVELKPSGWGTKVTLIATPVAPESAGVPPETGKAVETDVAAETEAVAAASDVEVAADPVPQPEADVDPPPVPEAAAEPEAEAAVQAAPRKRGFFARLFRRPPRPADTVVQEPEPPAADAETIALDAEAVPGIPEPAPAHPEAPDPEPAPTPSDPEATSIASASAASDETLAILMTMLDTLGAAHHRPFSRG